MLDILEHVFYHVGVLASEAVRILAARIRRSRRQGAPGQPGIPVDGVVAGRVLSRTTVVGPGSLALEAGRPVTAGAGEMDECGHHASTLLINAELNERLLPLRRGGDLAGISCEILTPMGSSSLGSDAVSDESAASADGLSAFVARVLDQLSLSAWLPAAFLTGGVALILEFRSTKSASPLNAVAKLTVHPITVLVIMIPLLVIATVITQAFSFEAIRFLEGYWSRRGPMGLAAKFMVRRHLRRKKAVVERARNESVKAFRAALPEIIIDSQEGISGQVIRAIEAHLSGRGADAPSLEGSEAQALVKTIQDWRNRAEAWRLERIDRLVAEYTSYPVDSRILPTKLGNLLRSTEDQLRHAGGDVRGFVLRQRDKVSRRVQMHHDQFRARLDMYCTLVFVSVFLTVVTPVALAGRVAVLPTAITTGSLAVMAVASYLAAISSAGGYCTALQRMDEAISAPDES